MTPRVARGHRRAAVLAFAVLPIVVTAACSSGSGGASSPSATVTSSALGSAAPSRTASSSSSSSSSAEASTTAATSVTGANPAYVAALQPQIDQVVADLGIVGAVVLVRSPTLGDWSTAIGTRTYKGSDPVTVDDHVRVGSNTKTMTATVILQLVEEGKIALTDPVSKYRPDVPNGDNITIGQLLDMRSGLGNYTAEPELNQQLDDNPGRVWTPEELVAMGLAVAPEFAPGQGWFYSNTNYVLLGAIIEQLTGNKVEDEFKARIFDPLGLTGSSMPALTDATIPAPHPDGYTFGTNVDTMDGDNKLSPEVQAGAKDGTLQPYDVTDENPSWGWTAGSAISTAGDLAVYVKAMVGGGLLNADLQQQRMASLLPVDPAAADGRRYGYGIGSFPSGFLGHTGELPGYNSVMLYNPDTDTTVVTWATNAPSPNGKAPAVELAIAVVTAVSS